MGRCGIIHSVMKQNVYDYSYELRRERQHRNLVIFILILSVIVFLSVFFTFVLFPVYVRSDSMETDISKGGVVFVSPVFKKSPERGDVIFIDKNNAVKNQSVIKKIINTEIKLFTAQQIQPYESNKLSSKPCLRRILALPGDTIYMKDYILYIKPAGDDHYLTEFELSENPYDIHIFSVPVGWNEIGSIGNFEEKTLSDDEYFVLADNRVEGIDSRIWGNISGEVIVGKAVLQYFPFNRIHRF